MSAPNQPPRREPRYRAIAKDIWRRLGGDGVTPGEPLPSELVLSADYEVSRLTIRQALDELRRSGAIEVRHGSGAFVATPPTLVEYTTRVQPPRGHDVSWRPGDGAVEDSASSVVEHRLDPPPGRPDPRPTVAGYLDSEPGRLQVLDTLMVKGGNPWIVNTYVFSDELVDALSLLGDDCRFRDALRQTLDEPLLHHWRAFSAATCSLADAEALHLQPGSAVLVREGVMGTRDRALVHVTRRMSGQSAKFVLRYLGPDDEEE